MSTRDRQSPQPQTQVSPPQASAAPPQFTPVASPSQVEPASPTNPFPRRPHETWVMESAPNTPIQPKGISAASPGVDLAKISLRPPEKQAAAGEDATSETKAQRSVADLPPPLFSLSPPTPRQPKTPLVQRQVEDTTPTEIATGESSQRGGIPFPIPLSPPDVPSHSSTTRGVPAIQAKLTIGQPNDFYEQEADRVAAQVVQQINAAPSAHPQATVALQRQAAPEEDELQMKPLLQRQAAPEEDELQMKPLLQRQAAPEEDELQMKSTRAQGVVMGDASADLEATINSARGSGQPLEPGLQRQMGQAMGADFGGVTVHTDATADRLNQSIQAKAFTTGQDIFFRGGAYNPGSRDGQELIAHELTHVVQQNGGAVQRSLFIQAAFEDAYVNDTAQLHDIDPSGKDKGTVAGGKKFKSGDTIQVNPAVSLGGGAWLSAEGSGKTGYIRATKVVLKSSLTAPTDPTLEGNTSEQGQEISDKLGGGLDSVSGGMEQAFIKENVGGLLKDKDSSRQSHGSTKSGLDIASGVGDSAMGIFGMVASASQISTQNNAWDNLAAGYGFVESLSKTGSGITKIIDSIAKVSGAKDGVGKSEMAGKITGAIADGLSSVKNAAMGVIGLYRLYKSQSDQKGKDALQILKALTEAAGSAAKVAKSAFDIIGNGIPMSLIRTVPALSIAVSAINLLIRLWDAFVAGRTKGEMGKDADTLRNEVATKLGENPPTVDNVDQSKIFDKDRRGTFPAYKTYFRLKQPVREAIKQIATTAVERFNNLGTTQRAARQDRSVTKRAHKGVLDTINATTLDGTIKDKLKTLAGDPKTVAEFQTQTVHPLKDLDQKVGTYEYVDKMSEINLKRQTGGWTDVILEIVSMAGEITTIAVGATGIGAAIGQGIKAASAGYKVAHGSAKFAQKLYRNRGDGSDKKSSQNKHREYVQHARFIYQQLAEFKPQNPPSQQDTTRAKELENYIRATGVNYGMWLSLKHTPSNQVEMLVDAMKQR